MLDLSPDELKTLTGRFAFDGIREYVLKNVYERRIFKNERLHMTYFLMKGMDSRLIETNAQEMIRRTLLFDSLVPPRPTTLILYWFPTPLKKKINYRKQSIDVPEINSGYTLHSPGIPYICIYRYEEALKVLLHECSHFYHLEHKLSNNIYDNYFINKYDIKIDCSLMETYSEVIGVIMNIYFISGESNNREKMYQLYLIELAFALQQCAKICDFFHIRSIRELSKLKSNTNIMTYFFLKTAFMLSNVERVDFDAFIDSLFHTSKPLVLENPDEFCRRIDENLQITIDTAVKYEEFNIDLPKEISDSMRMTIVDFIEHV